MALISRLCGIAALATMTAIASARADSVEINWEALDYLPKDEAPAETAPLDPGPQLAPPSATKTLRYPDGTAVRIVRPLRYPTVGAKVATPTPSLRRPAPAAKEPVVDAPAVRVDEPVPEDDAIASEEVAALPAETPPVEPVAAPQEVREAGMPGPAEPVAVAPADLPAEEEIVDEAEPVPTPAPAAETNETAETRDAAPKETEVAALPPAGKRAPKTYGRFTFPSDSADLLPDQRARLDALVPTLKAGNARFEIRSYAGMPEDKSSEARRLSLKRAIAVRGYLLSQGVSASRLYVRALGGPPVDDPSERVEIGPAAE